MAVDVDGTAVTLRFAKIAVNVATDRPGGPNVLPQLMRRWFGPTAGQPGTRHRVELVPLQDGWKLRPRAEPPGVGEVIIVGAGGLRHRGTPVEGTQHQAAARWCCASGRR